MRRAAIVPAAVAVVLVIASCGGGASGAAAGPGHSGALLPVIRLSSPAFHPLARIPRIYTCDGADISPPLHWSGVPSQATSLTLTMRDPDAPGGNFIHWHLTGIPVSTTALTAGHVPAGVNQGVNGFGTTGYRGPCPPRGDPPHHYVITLTALRGHRAIAVGSLTGTFGRR